MYNKKTATGPAQLWHNSTDNLLAVQLQPKYQIHGGDLTHCVIIIIIIIMLPIKHTVWHNRI
jgi:hypothetical protein